MSKQPLSRRTVLRGLGTAIALPMLDAMGPTRAMAESSATAPRRMAMCFIPNGCIMDEWHPTGEGRDYQLSKTLAPLAPVRDDVLVLGELTADKARSNGDGAGDHARCSAAFLTASQPKKTSGKDIHVGVSMDQVYAQKLGHLTRFPSLELGTDPGRNVGNCDSGYSCAYSSNISWRTANMPMAKEINPRLVFERLFGTDEERHAIKERAKRNIYKKSILDFASDDAKSLTKDLGVADKRKVDEYFNSIREIEVRVAKAQAQTESNWIPDYKKPDGIPSDFKDHLRLMADMMVLAFQGDLTRVSTFMFAKAGSNKPYRAIGVNQGHHSISHHNNDPNKVKALQKIDQFHVEQFVYLIEKMKSVKEGQGTLLDNSMIMLGSGIGEGHRHRHHDLPIILAGRGGGTITPGRHIRYAENTPIANLYLEMLDRMGMEEKSFGDSTGRLDHLTA